MKHKKIETEIVTLSERGQLVIPKKMRQKFGLKTGDKMMVIGQPHGFLVIFPVEKLENWFNKIIRGFGHIKKIIQQNSKKRK